MVLWFYGFAFKQMEWTKKRTLKPKESSFNVILLEKTDLSIAIEAKGMLPSMSFRACRGICSFDFDFKA